MCLLYLRATCMWLYPQHWHEDTSTLNWIPTCTVWCATAVIASSSTLHNVFFARMCCKTLIVLSLKFTYNANNILTSFSPDQQAGENNELKILFVCHWISRDKTLLIKVLQHTIAWMYTSLVQCTGDSCRGTEYIKWQFRRVWLYPHVNAVDTATCVWLCKVKTHACGCIHCLFNMACNITSYLSIWIP